MTANGIWDLIWCLKINRQTSSRYKNGVVVVAVFSTYS